MAFSISQEERKAAGPVGMLALFQSPGFSNAEVWQNDSKDWLIGTPDEDEVWEMVATVGELIAEYQNML